ncbi:hypothetical protein FGO68_gene14560 [Halteria grandinella]|uniref:Uncharacterized protein n=1 Tax=Halteria grandinella TaxID=5974 RepID=A0A8J8N9N5_HALGN|nr:hypothetical protein FGO68_gene14560 [Halteria grandinella]
MIYQGCSSFNSQNSQFELWSSFHKQSLFNLETKVLKPRKKAKKKSHEKSRVKNRPQIEKRTPRSLALSQPSPC